jgi:hypothetical protein
VRGILPPQKAFRQTGHVRQLHHSNHSSYKGDPARLGQFDPVKRGPVVAVRNQTLSYTIRPSFNGRATPRKLGG